MSNAEQKDYWTAQTSWVSQQEAMDQNLGPVLDLVLERAQLRPGQSVLDIGCGTGASLLAAATHVGVNGHVEGVDISASLLELAKDRTADYAHISVREADAAADDLGGPYDAMISRFGVMFFADTTGAFAHIRRALKPGAQLTFAAWAPPAQNPYFMAPAQAAQSVLGKMPKADRTLPGPFAMEDPERIIPMLSAAGLTEIACDPVPLHLQPSGSLADVARLCLLIGPPAGAIRHFDADADQIDAVHAAVMEALSPFETPQGLRLPAVINLYTAIAP